MDEIKIGLVNGIEITAFEKDDQYFVPIKPICTALGIDIEPQRKKIMEDKYLAPVAVLETATGADNRLYEMFCLPLFFIPGWLFSINPKNVAPEARENVRKYRWECYQTLYDHFLGPIVESNQMGSRAREISNEITEMKESLLENKIREKEIKSRIYELKAEYEAVTAKMINPERHLFNIDPH